MERQHFVGRLLHSNDARWDRAARTHRRTNSPGPRRSLVTGKHRTLYRSLAHPDDPSPLLAMEQDTDVSVPLHANWPGRRRGRRACIGGHRRRTDACKDQADYCQQHELARLSRSGHRSRHRRHDRPDNNPGALGRWPGLPTSLLHPPIFERAGLERRPELCF